MDDTKELGTKASAFSGGGPFSCMNCRFRTPHSLDKNKEEVDSCSHPTVMDDPELKDRKLPDGTIRVDFDDCCRFVWPEEMAKEEREKKFSFSPKKVRNG